MFGVKTFDKCTDLRKYDPPILIVSDSLVANNLYVQTEFLGTVK